MPGRERNQKKRIAKLGIPLKIEGSSGKHTLYDFVYIIYL